jgi:lysozyme
MPKITDLITAQPDKVWGIDISSCQGPASKINWGQVEAAGTSFCFCKATEGVTIQDSQFRTNYENMATFAIVRGSYHFFRGGHDGKEQAENFLNQVEDIFDISDLPPVIDVEALYDKVPFDTQIDYILEWIDIVGTKLSTQPIIYTSLRVIRDLFKNTTRFGGHSLWVVDYRTGVKTPRLPVGFTDWKFWQLGDKGMCPGIQPNVDYNCFNGNQAALDQFISDSHI